MGGALLIDNLDAFQIIYLISPIIVKAPGYGFVTALIKFNITLESLYQFICICRFPSTKICRFTKILRKPVILPFYD